MKLNESFLHSSEVIKHLSLYQTTPEIGLCRILAESPETNVIYNKSGHLNTIGYCSIIHLRYLFIANRDVCYSRLILL